MGQSNNWKKKTMIIGAVAGAIAGIVAGAILVQRSEKTNHAPQLTAGDGVKVGLGVLGVLRLIADLGDGK
ncbi:MAG: hypothetical protein ABFD29_05970 [Anaerolineaceae bacterium]